MDVLLMMGIVIWLIWSKDDKPIHTSENSFENMKAYQEGQRKAYDSRDVS